MKKKKSMVRRDPYFGWKIVNMILALAVLILTALATFAGRGWAVTAAYLAGALMCAISGIMELSKGRRVTGYFCSVLAGILAVALLITVVRIGFL